VDAQQALRPTDAEGRQLIELPRPVDAVPTLDATLTPIGDGRHDRRSSDGSRGLCPPVTTTHSSIDFDGKNVELGIQAGFVADETAAASYTIDPAEFPITIRTTDFIIAREFIGGEVTTEYTWIVWQGTPTNGAIVASFSSDGEILPHATMQANEQALNIQITVDPGDKEQIVVEDNGSATFTIGYRIDVMNDPPTSSCNLGITPAPCCPHNTQTNAFPTTDTINPDDPDVPTGNWLRCRSNCGLGACPGGWHRFDQLGDLQPGGDWNIRVKYEPFDCPDPDGACCFTDGTACTEGPQSQCLSTGGIFQGEGTTCAQIQCPEPIGACCFYDGTSQCVVETEAQCATRHDPDNGLFATWSGPGTTCTDPPGPQCSDQTGACCFPDDSCVTTSFFNCGIAGGTFQGVDTDCVNFVCNPQGACCMPDGSCMDDVAEADCIAAGGTFQGDGVACSSVSCPQPTGACCLSNGNCIIESEATCLQFPGASWAGPDTSCADTDGNGAADDCEAGSDCPADLAEDDNTVNVFDLLELLAGWGADGAGADLAEPNDVVNVFDLLELLGQWGPCS